MIACSIALVVGCGSDDGANPAGENGDGGVPSGAMVAQPPADIPAPVRDELIELAEDVAAALCERAEGCCSELDALPNTACVDHAAFVWLDARQARTDEPTATLTYAFDESFAAECRTRLSALPRDCSFDSYVPEGDEMPALFGLQSACAGALRVSIDGQPARQCWQDVDCIAHGSGLACLAGSCEPRGAPGQACQGDHRGSCESGAFCVQSICVPGAELGDACSATGEPGCVEPLACERGLCVVPPQPGDACLGIGDCGVGLRCVPESESDPIGPGICAAIGPGGKLPCEADWQCPTQCARGYCEPHEHHFCAPSE